MSKHALSGRVTPAAFRVWQEIHEHGPLTAAQVHERIGGERKEYTRGLVQALLDVKSIEECGTVPTKGARARQYRTVKLPDVRVSAVQQGILDVLAAGPLSFEAIQQALRLLDVRPNPQRLGRTLQIMGTAGKVVTVEDGRGTSYGLPTDEPRTRPSRRDPAACRLSERIGAVRGPSGRMLSTREEWIDG
jgi:hypothetical protein